MDLCRKFEEAEKLCQPEKAGKTEHRMVMICSEDTPHSSKVSINTSSKEPQQLQTFSSLRDNWENRSLFSARKPVLRQRKLSYSKSGLLLVNSSTNRKRGGDTDKGSVGKRYKGS